MEKEMPPAREAGGIVLKAISYYGYIAGLEFRSWTVLRNATIARSTPKDRSQAIPRTRSTGSHL